MNFRCPDDLATVIDQRVAEMGVDKSRVVVDALRYALGATDIPSDAIVGKSKLLELINRVNELDRKYQRLSKLIAES
ncbi:MAG: hypothetical protein ACRCXH_13480 [Shewanella sp.]